MSIFSIEPGYMSFCMEKGGTVTSKLIMSLSSTAKLIMIVKLIRKMLK